jgi:hypothetical protein
MSRSKALKRERETKRKRFRGERETAMAERENGVAHLGRWHGLTTGLNQPMGICLTIHHIKF